MPEIAGYTDRQYIKGQYYAYAASPKPVTFVGDIDDLSDESLLLTKAMFVSRGQVTGHLPNDTANTFLITTVKYGESAYLQTAYVIDSGFSCWEYRRIYSGGWSPWVAVDASIKNVADSVQSAITTANSALGTSTELSRQVSTLNGSVETALSSVTSVANSVSSLSGSVQQISSKVTPTDISPSYQIAKTGGDSKWNSAVVSAIRAGNTVNMQIDFGFNKGTWSAGATPYSGTLSGGPLPVYPARLLAYYTSSLIVCTITPDGTVQVRIISGTLAPGGSRDSTKVTGTFVFNG